MSKCYLDSPYWNQESYKNQIKESVVTRIQLVNNVSFWTNYNVFISFFLYYTSRTKQERVSSVKYKRKLTFKRYRNIRDKKRDKTRDNKYTQMTSQATTSQTVTPSSLCPLCSFLRMFTNPIILLLTC